VLTFVKFSLIIIVGHEVIKVAVNLMKTKGP